ncbi:hypothetical protein ACVGVM_29175 (plasmid) [Pseudonocardia bannensis]|uniref:Uncharacterized protein n=1 Tax=Pseudonocardia bannensis TaxID=630973 RepID=A0A848DLU5_9PSEU|nr:hypothetical protein [Pseudonocardia bannensis]NMH93513.1 hypothetical protein [Pseudonocardia bannensis]
MDYVYLWVDGIHDTDVDGVWATNDQQPSAAAPEDDAAPDRDPQRTGPEPGVGATSRAARAGGSGVDDAEAMESAVSPLLVAALPGEVLDKVRQSPGYDRLRDGLFAQYQQGRSVAALLDNLAADKIGDANDPASYLGAIVGRRVESDRLRPTLPDRSAMVDLVARGLPRSVADKVVGCSGWPGLAKRIDAWQRGGLPVEDMLESLPAGRISTAGRPAAYTTALMSSTAQNLRKQARDEQSGPERPDPFPGRADAEPDLSWTDELAGPTNWTRPARWTASGSSR